MERLRSRMVRYWRRLRFPAPRTSTAPPLLQPGWLLGEGAGVTLVAARVLCTMRVTLLNLALGGLAATV